jgi:hypothetical protein
MLDPDEIIVQSGNLPSLIKINEVPEFETEVYCLEDDKERKKFIKDVENRVRRSFEYKRFIGYIRDYMQMNQDAFLEGVDNKESYNIKIEIHHYPFTLYDIVEIILNKRSYYKESLSVNMVAKEVMSCHYKLIIGLISLAETTHELNHNSRIFIPVDKILGRYRLFIEYYKPFIEPYMLETVERIEKYSEEKTSNILDTNILRENRVTYDIKDSRYSLPAPDQVSLQMVEQMKLIKDNNYLLPTVDDIKMLEKKPECPIEFDNTLKNKTGRYSWM